MSIPIPPPGPPAFPVPPPNDNSQAIQSAEKLIDLIHQVAQEIRDHAPKETLTDSLNQLESQIEQLKRLTPNSSSLVSADEQLLIMQAEVLRFHIGFDPDTDRLLSFCHAMEKETSALINELKGQRYTIYEK